MDNNEKIELFFERFVHDNSIFAEQKYYPDMGVAYFPMREGSCTHSPRHAKKDCPDIRNIIFEKKHLLMHLQGKKTYAPYQISEDNKVKWLCLDFDSVLAEDDPLVVKTVKNACKKLSVKFENGFLLEGSGSKGYHIWIFFKEPLEAEYAYSFGHALADSIETPEEISIEVYPKQTTRRILGNTVKPPFGVHQKTGNRCWILDQETLEPVEDQWESLKNVRTIRPDWVRKNYTPSPTQDVESSDSKAMWAPTCLVHLMEKGGHAGFKDEPAFKLACYLRSKGIPKDLAETMLLEWNNKNSPPMRENVILTKIDSAYANDYSWRPCGLPTFDHICHSTCPFFKDKVKYRWGDKEGDPRGVISNG